MHSRVLWATARHKVKLAPRLYVQVKKVIEKEDKALPEGATTPIDPPSLRKWVGRDAAFKDFASTSWQSQNLVVELAGGGY